MNPNISLPQLPANLDPALRDYLFAWQKLITQKQLDDYNNSSDLNTNLETKITAVGDGITESGGSDANRYIKFRDGTLIQWCNVVVAHETITNQNIGTYGWSYYGGSLVKTFPIPFIDNNYNVIGTSNSWRSACTIWKTSVSQCTVLLLSPASNSSPVSVIAIGRWK